jgi:uncharacterized protein YgiM (DUF1202 family)
MESKKYGQNCSYEIELYQDDNLIAKLKSIGITNVCIKYHEGAITTGGGINFKNAFLAYVDYFKNAGFTVGSWGYNYFNNVLNEANIINEALDHSDYYIFDAETTVSGKSNEAEQVCKLIRDKHPNSIIGYSSFPIVGYHSDIPYTVFNEYCDFASPQCYWDTMGYSVNDCIDEMLKNYNDYGLNKPIYPSIQGYDTDLNSYNLYKNYNFKATGIWSVDSMDSNFETFMQSSDQNNSNSEHDGETGIVTASALNIRSGAGIQYPVITSAINGTNLTILGSSNGWYHVKLLNGLTGWASMQYIKIEDTNTVLKVNLNISDAAKENTTVPYYLKDGKNNIVKFSAFEDDNMIHFYGNSNIQYNLRDNAKNYSDIGTHWAKNDIDFVTARELFNGLSDSYFCTDGYMTRGMVVTVLGRLLEADTQGYAKSRFADVKADAWYSPYVEWAAEKGIVSGIGNNNFAPETAISREELSLILSNFIQFANLKLSEVNKNPASFSDSSNISSWAQNAITSMQKYGILTGKGNNQFDPKGTATRAEVAAMLHRLISRAVE